MSDDSLGGFGPTTPAHAIKKPKIASRAATAKSTKLNQAVTAGDQDPGPSKRPTGNAVGRPSKRRKEEEVVVQTDDDEDGGEGQRREEAAIVVEDIVASSDEDEVREEIEKGVNGKAKGRAGGGAKQQQRGKLASSRREASKKVMEVEESEEEEDVVHVDAPPTQAPRSGKASRTAAVTSKEKASGRSTAQGRRDKANVVDLEETLEGQDGVAALIDRFERPRKPDSRKDAEVARLIEKNSELEKKNQILASQMEELCRVRDTESEGLLKRLEVQYEAKMRALEDMVQALTAQLTKRQPLAGTGKSSIIHIITQEAAEEARQALDKEVVKLKNELADATKKLSLKDQEILELKQTQEELRVELKAEINRANTLAKQTTRHPQPTPRSGVIAEDPKHREAIKLYEDLTNIIILNVRSMLGPSGKDEWFYMCCYTHTNETDSVNATTHSLSFSLRSYENTVDDQRANWIQYLPMALDKESPDFVEKLNFLGAAFQFERVQLALFLRTLYTTIEDIVKAGQESDEDGGEDEEMAPA